MISLSTIIRFLFFQADAIREIASNRKALIVGLLLVVSAGFAREYDGEYLLAEPWHLALPLLASIIGCIAMVILVGCAAYFRGARSVGVVNTFLSFLSMYWMTAPLAWLYAIPVERFLSPGDATRVNLALLGLVALWRVALMVRCVQVVYGARLLSAFVPIILFSDILALLALRFVPGPIFMIMGGVRLSESEEIILSTRMMLGFFGVVSLPIWIIAFVVVCRAKPRWQWFDSEAQTGESTGRVSLGAWLAVTASLLIWIPVLPTTQKEQSLRWESERLIRSGDIGGFAELVRSSSEESFPPHWDPPPRLGYGETQPHLHSVMAGLIAHDAPAWIRTQYEDKMVGFAHSHFHFWEELDNYTDEELEQYVSTIEQLDHADEMASNYSGYVDYVLQEQSPSEQRRASLVRLRELASDDDQALDEVESDDQDEVENRISR